MKSETSNIINKGSLTYITFKNLEKTDILNHAFSTKFGGVSEGFFSSMNMSFNRGDKKEAVYKNYEILCDAVGINTENLVFTKQTHTNNVITVTEKERGIGFNRPPFNDIDGLVTNRKNVALVTQFADCTPLLFCDPIKRVIGSSHSGWRGTVKRIGKKTIELMEREFSCDRNDILVAIGPSICKDCYEVDKSVFDEFKSEGFDTNKIFFPKENGKYMLDLKTANKNILLDAGIPLKNIEVCDICTKCNSDEMFSHRAQGVNRGNLCAIIELK